MNRILRLSMLLLCAAVLFAAAPAQAADDKKICKNERSPHSAMWFSLLHPGLGEYHLKGNWRAWGNMPSRKFWYGWVPIFGWPGYLQVKSAVDASRCRTNDEIFFD